MRVSSDDNFPRDTGGSLSDSYYPLADVRYSSLFAMFFRFVRLSALFVCPFCSSVSLVRLSLLFVCPLDSSVRHVWLSTLSVCPPCSSVRLVRLPALFVYLPCPSVPCQQL
jgi:hypothetical protein